jgi:hypothetical protein
MLKFFCRIIEGKRVCKASISLQLNYFPSIDFFYTFRKTFPKLAFVFTEHFSAGNFYIEGGKSFEFCFYDIERFRIAGKKASDEEKTGTHPLRGNIDVKCQTLTTLIIVYREQKIVFGRNPKKNFARQLGERAFQGEKWI